MKIRFVINPRSGAGKKGRIQQLIENSFPVKHWHYEIKYTERPGHATELSREASERGYTAVVAIGGDGSVNEVAKGLVHSGTAMGIIPSGSGNGIARHFCIPLSAAKALNVIRDMHIVRMDTGRLNDVLFAGTAGVGFDAYISKRFAGLGKRGLSGYIRLITKEYPRYAPGQFTVHLNGKTHYLQSLMLTVANCSQYGNGALIAPFATTHDGLLDLVAIDKLSYRQLPSFLFKMYRGRLDTHCPYFTAFHAECFAIEQTSDYAHIDGESIKTGKELNFRIDPLSLKIIIPKQPL